MNVSGSETYHRIINAAKSEFLEKGFCGASLRKIVKAADVTTGAFYGYFKSKESLFEELVGRQYDTVMDKYNQAQRMFKKLSPQEQRADVGNISGECMDWMTEYIYQNLDAFKLILSCSEGTKYENMIHDMVEIEIEATHAFVHVLENLGPCGYKIEPYLEHMLISGFFSAYFEIVIHDIPYEKAKRYVRDLRAFYTAGWQKIIGW